MLSGEIALKITIIIIIIITSKNDAAVEEYSCVKLMFG